MNAFLKCSATVLCLGACIGIQTGTDPAAALAQTTTKAVPYAARPLPLSAVRLTGGPLKHAQDLDAAYLLKLEPDRMLAFFRQRAGLEPKAKPYGGWDVAVKRKWASGDTVALVLPKRLRAEPLPDNPNRVALMWGPLVLAGDVQPEEGQQREQRQGTRADRAGVPVFVASGRSVEKWLKPVAGKTGSFSTDGVGRERDVDFMPSYRLHRRPYAVYWDLFTPEAWEKQAAEYAAERARQRKLEAATLAYAQPGEMQPERDFNFQGEDTEPVRLLNRPGRHGGKWFSFDLPVEKAHPMTLIVTYHSDERKKRSFEILVDGRRLAEQKIENTAPPRFFDVEYPIPPELHFRRIRVAVG